MLTPITSTAAKPVPSSPALTRGARPAPAPVTHPFNSPIEMMGAPMSFPRNGEIYGEGEPADFVYKVVSGTVRTYKVLADGRRQIGAFYLPGDVFGFEVGDDHAFSAEAITGSKLLVVRRSGLVGAASRDGDVARELWTLVERELARFQEHVLLLIKSAQERVATFLLWMADRMPDGDTVELPMGRQDIADYLGLTMETVSRTLTSFASDGAIELLSARRVMLRKRGVLVRLNA